MKKIFFLMSIFLLLVIGCSWTPRTVLPEYFRVIHMPKFKNNTLQPQLVEFINQKFLEKFEMDGRLTATEHVSKADGILFGTISKYKKAPLSYSDLGELDVNALTIGIEVKLRDIKSGKWLHDSYLEETVEFNFISEPVETEIDAQK
ncbi:MAG: hypothetical protein KKH98_11890, partial [Spirochaetes bacterium]|nr:hypothetical protein [Spirochaetota bacterium]